MLYGLLSEYNKKNVVPMHMPGHKRNTAMLGDGLPYGIDITEIDGFDNLHDARGVLKETADLASRLYGSGRSFLLVNGSTGGILAGVRSAVRYGGTVVMARNCHMSVYNAAEICGLKPAYLLPDLDEAAGICGSVRPEQVEKAVKENPEAGLIIVTSPTYEGVVSDIKAICDIAHRQKIPVLVDAAHGAHFGFSGFFPPNPVSCGADIVVMSLHKTLPALTQCALLHVSGGFVDENRLASELAVFQTSSPSYVLLSSADSCLRLLDGGGERLFLEYQKNLETFDGIISGLGKLRVLCHGADSLENHGDFFGFDPGKIVVGTRGTNLTGHELARLLRSKYRIEPEMAYTDYAVAMTSICDSRDAVTQLARALLDADSEAEAGAYGDKPHLMPPLPHRLVTASEAAGIKGEYRPVEKAAGAMSLEYVWSYPPGIPYIVPGELIDGDIAAFLKQSAGAGIPLKSTKGKMPLEIYCAPVSDACSSCLLF